MPIFHESFFLLEALYFHCTMVFSKRDIGIGTNDKDQSRKMMKHYKGFMSSLCGILMFGGK